MMKIGTLSVWFSCAAVGAAACASPPSTAGDEASGVSPLAATAVAGRDLAIALSLESASLPSALDRLGGGPPLLPPAWYNEVVRAYGETSVGSALESENLLADWRVVSLRLAPCAPLGLTPAHDVDRLCWPEVRLVWQPILPGFSDDNIGSDTHADDRAIHALYDAPPEAALGAADAARARELLAAVGAYNAAWSGGPYAPLGASELGEFVALRDQVTRALLDAALALRSGAIPASAYAGVGLRPESGKPSEEKALRGRLLGLFATYARPERLKALTSFSLPEGRQPALLDEWVFLSFRASGGTLVQENVTFRAPDDGRVLFDFGPSESASASRDDAAIYDVLDDPTDGPAIAESVILFNTDRARLAPVLADRGQRLVPNTSCASCHKLNPLRFDFHNFSYLEDRELTVSPRVVTDVALDLAWVASHAP
ncbi:MAG TPA: hypothetical protein VFS43_39715 [Polyangiaceae bacterium]|nr:hypothetical protein [Polyangiaceae bacterium]